MHWFWADYGEGSAQIEKFLQLVILNVFFIVNLLFYNPNIIIINLFVNIFSHIKVSSFVFFIHFIVIKLLVS